MNLIKGLTLAALLATSSASSQYLNGESNNSYYSAEPMINKLSAQDLKMPVSEFVKKDIKTVPLENIMMNESELDWTYIGGIIAATGFGAYEVHKAYTHQFWWPDRSPAHWMVDNNYALGIDKAGHAFAFNTLSTGYYFMFKSAGFDDMTSRIIGTAFGMAWQGYSEGHELRGPKGVFGGDPLDVAGGWLGASKVLLDGLFPFLDRFTLKMSFYPRQHPKYSGYNSMENDYEHQNTWLSYNIKNGWSVALGVRMSTWKQGDPDAHVQLMLAPDFDLRVLSNSPIVTMIGKVMPLVPAVIYDTKQHKFWLGLSYKID